MLSITHGTMDLHAKRKARESTSCCPTTYLCTYLSYLCVLTYLLTLDPVRYICITSPVLCSEPVTAVTCRITHLSCSSCKSKPVLFFACGFAGSYEVITRASELCGLLPFIRAWLNFFTLIDIQNTGINRVVSPSLLYNRLNAVFLLEIVRFPFFSFLPFYASPRNA